MALTHHAYMAQRKTEVAAELAAAIVGDLEVRELVGALRSLRQLAQTVESATESAVALARREGLSWAQIGAELGVSKQGAQQRYGAIAGGVSL